MARPTGQRSGSPYPRLDRMSSVGAAQADPSDHRVQPEQCHEQRQRRQKQLSTPDERVQAAHRVQDGFHNAIRDEISPASSRTAVETRSTPPTEHERRSRKESRPSPPVAPEISDSKESKEAKKRKKKTSKEKEGKSGWGWHMPTRKELKQAVCLMTGVIKPTHRIGPLSQYQLRSVSRASQIMDLEKAVLEPFTNQEDTARDDERSRGGIGEPTHRHPRPPVQQAHRITPQSAQIDINSRRAASAPFLGSYRGETQSTLTLSSGRGTYNKRSHTGNGNSQTTANAETAVTEVVAAAAKAAEQLMQYDQKCSRQRRGHPRTPLANVFPGAHQRVDTVGSNSQRRSKSPG